MAKREDKVPTAPKLLYDGRSKSKDGKCELIYLKEKYIYANYNERHHHLEEEGQRIHESWLFYDVVGGQKKGHVYKFGSTTPLYYNAPSKVQSSQKASTYVPDIISQMEALQREPELVFKFIRVISYSSWIF
ncbi:hypothetical protein RND81_11G152400 [Saponaria officinalis]|uniref:Uncharacterized protein n=1 Tax=Saponaria officinalis TaxID=3572 RepID=A0AAW1HLG6_SAPOF